MSLRAAIHSSLLASTGVTDLIGTSTDMRHYSGRVPQSPEFPFVVSYEISSSPVETHGLPTDAEDTLDETLVQFSCYAETLTSALSIRAAIRSALLDPTETSSALVLATAGIRVTNPSTREDYEDGLDVHGAQIDLTFFHNPNT